MPHRSVLAPALVVAAVGLGFQATFPAFEPLSPALLAEATLVNAWADFDDDENADLFVGFNGQPNRLYRNEGGRLTDVAADRGVADARPTRAAAPCCR